MTKLYHVALLLPCISLLSSAAPLHRVPNTRTYIVKLKSEVVSSSHLLSSGYTQYRDRIYDTRVLNGYTINLTPGAMDGLRQEFAQQIDYIEEDQIIHPASQLVQTDATWGLQRITQQETLPSGSDAIALNYTYHYDSSAGEGVDIYVFDTGVFIEHEEFEGRAMHSPVFARDSTVGDRYGHGSLEFTFKSGTHCAGSAAGARYGVAKKANIIDVKVLTDTGIGYTSDIIAGLSWAVANAHNTSRTGVINMSLGARGATALSDAVKQTIASGLTVVVAAGNEQSSATEYAPANVEEAIVVGNLDITGAQYRTSNYGPTLDVFAPGTNVVSAGISSPNATKVDTGTSMAAPHVAGLAAYLLSLEGPRTPAEVSARIVELSVPGVFSGLSPNTTSFVAQSVA